MIHGKPITAIISLEGECSCCGRCCSDVDSSGQSIFCENLAYESPESVISGTPESTICRKYEERYNRMPIKMLYPDGTEAEVEQHYCWVGSKNELKAIMDRGIGFGCSLNLRISELPLHNTETK